MNNRDIDLGLGANTDIFSVESNQKEAKLAPYKDIMNSSSMSSTVPTIKCEDTSPSPTAALGDGDSGTYNLSVNVNLSSAMINLLSAETVNSTTLRTPEIVNDVITMTNPLDQYNYNDKNSSLKVRHCLLFAVIIPSPIRTYRITLQNY